MFSPPLSVANHSRRLGWLRRMAEVVAVLAICSLAHALDPTRSLYQYNCQTWTRQTGLPVNAIAAITQTADGHLWLATQKGLVRFDGLQFTSVELPVQFRNQVVLSLAAAQEGGLWFALNRGSFGFYDGREKFTTVNETWAPPGLPVVSLAQAPDRAVWLASEQGYGRYAPGRAGETFFSTEFLAVRHVSVDPRGRAWLTTLQQGVKYWDGGKTGTIPDDSLRNEQALVSLAEADGLVWVGTQTGLRCYDAELRPRVIPRFPYQVRALLRDRQGVLWIGTTDHGVACLKNGKYTFFDQRHGLAHNYVNHLFEDREGSVWIATRGGLSQLADVKFPIFTVADGLLEEGCYDVSPSRNGGVWIATNGGISHFADARITSYSAAAGLSARFVKRVLESRSGDVYMINANRGIEILADGKAVGVFIADGWPTSLAEDAEGVIVSVGGALFRASRNGLVPFTLAPGETWPATWLRNIIVAGDGSLWVASVEGILRVHQGRVQRWSTAEGISDNNIQTLCEDDTGTVWAGLTTGIVRIQNGVARNIRRSNGLFDDSIRAIVPGDDGNLWVNSSQGIFRVDRQAMNDFADGKIPAVRSVPYNGLHVVKTIDTTHTEYTGCKSSDGRIWFPTPLGPVMIDPARILKNSIPPPIQLQGVRANGVELPLQARAIVPPGRGELEFRFAAPSFIAPQDVQFRYRLEGYDADWAEAGNRRFAFYTNLRPGRYTFRVMAANADGVWSEKEEALAVELEPHFYQTAWFYVLIAGLVLAALTGVYLWRMRHLRRKALELHKNRLLLENEVRVRTAELGAANQSLQREVEDRERAQQQLKHRTESLEKEIEERKRAQAEVEKIHRQLLEVSRQAGMAEVATGVLHNVGNVLNSVNVSATLVIDRMRRSKLLNLQKLGVMLEEHAGDLANFLANDPKGQRIPSYLQALTGQLAGEQEGMVEELSELRKNIEHIKDIVAMQQNYANVRGVIETVRAVELVEDAVRINLSALGRHGVEVVRDYQAEPTLNIDRHKVMQILVNLVSNAKRACSDADRTDKTITVRITQDGERAHIAIVDNGIGIVSENLTRIFVHGFTTRKDGHGFGLHSGALAAKEVGGMLVAESEGIGRGATFTLTLPLNPPAR